MKASLPPFFHFTNVSGDYTICIDSNQLLIHFIVLS
ncbi:Hypothetical protein LEPBI_I2956 [Leptospira biflexa serovar Patoc strain 'Patoc 1 (Paris)']|uniref:Uncharacterized protein n=1 Tax=Leptospira biflexa serovar Patoc (strain Patoc 1 / ATCC 23582 / Paris) TaxID=456481 RepID=B0SP12_LEPBP|nr:Hypothetical protein LEPBI_I2956 [Leptospira biflexa serovar Patoc strain 'Patoc 1 (Paris)']